MSTSNLAVPENKLSCNLRLMSNIGERVRSRRTELGLSQKQLAEKAGGLSYQAVQQIEGGGGSKHIVPIAQALGVSAEWLQGVEKEPVNQVTKKHGTFAQHGAQADANGLLKVLGMAECGPDGWSLWNGETVDHVPRPPNLAGAPQAYAVFVVGTSMEDRYHPGELAFIHPGKPVTPGSYVLVQIHPKVEGELPRAVLKRLVRRTGNRVILEQLSPAKTFELKVDEIVSMHRVVGSGEA